MWTTELDQASIAAAANLHMQLPAFHYFKMLIDRRYRPPSPPPPPFTDEVSSSSLYTICLTLNLHERTGRC